MRACVIKPTCCCTHVEVVGSEIVAVIVLHQNRHVAVVLRRQTDRAVCSAATVADETLFAGATGGALEPQTDGELAVGVVGIGEVRNGHRCPECAVEVPAVAPGDRAVFDDLDVG